MKAIGIAFAACIPLLSGICAAATTYTYDSLNRLTRVDYGNATTTSYSYDPAGNRLSSTAVIEGTLDADGSTTTTKYDALTDGLLIFRYLSGLTGPSLTTGALGGTATWTDPDAIKTHLDGIRPALDIDGNGTADALTDGLLIIRYLFGLRGPALIAGAVGPLATRKTAADIEAYLQTIMP